MGETPVPQQSHFLHRLEFSTIETAFYDALHKYCTDNFVGTVQRHDCMEEDICKLRAGVQTHLLKAFTELCRASSHPLLSEVHHHIRTTISIAELLDIKIRRTKHACERIHDQYVSILNDAGAMYMITNDYSAAIMKYSEAWQCIETHSPIFGINIFHKIHSLHHLAEAVQSMEISHRLEGRYSAFRRATLMNAALCSASVNDIAKNLHNTCVEKHHTSIETEKANLCTLIEETCALRLQFQCNPVNPWWVQITSPLPHEEADLCNMLKAELQRNGIGNLDVAYNFNSVDGLKYLVDNSLKTLFSQRDSVLKLMFELPETPDYEECERLCNCHLGPFGKNRMNPCIACRIAKTLKEYEHTVLDYNGENQRGHDDKFEDSEDEAEIGEIQAYLKQKKDAPKTPPLEIIFKFLQNMAEQSEDFKLCAEDGVTDLKLLEALKAEYKCVRRLWIKYTAYLADTVKVSSAKLRKRLRRDGEGVGLDFLTSKVMLPEQAEQYIIQLPALEVETKVRLQRKLGDLTFLENLRANENEEASSQGQQDCPICIDAFHPVWVVLPCGHSVCESCVCTLRRRSYVRGNIHCPVCRKNVLIENISYVHSPAYDNVIQGFWSAKISGIIKCLKEIYLEDNEAKSMIFSSFPGFFDFLEKFLVLNEIPYAKLEETQANWAEFKETTNVRVLLLPYSACSHRLNIIDATHLLLVEPKLQLKEVQRAVRQIHRISKTKATTIHQFYVKDTIEEAIYRVEEPYLFFGRPIEPNLTFYVKDYVAFLHEKYY